MMCTSAIMFKFIIIFFIAVVAKVTCADNVKESSDKTLEAIKFQCILDVMKTFIQIEKEHDKLYATDTPGGHAQRTERPSPEVSHILQELHKIEPTDEVVETTIFPGSPIHCNKKIGSILSDLARAILIKSRIDEPFRGAI